MQMSRDAIGGLFTTVVVTVALAKRSFLSVLRGSAALRSVASNSMHDGGKKKVSGCVNLGLPLHFFSHLFPKLLQSVQLNGVFKMCVTLLIASCLRGQNICIPLMYGWMEILQLHMKPTLDW